MAMKILNQFIDDFVGVFQYRFMDTFQYFKERKKSKYLGDRFEEWVVKNSNISKDGYSDLCDKKIWKRKVVVLYCNTSSLRILDMLLRATVARRR